MMQLTPKKIAAIKALADDERGEPNTRAAAKMKLEQYRRDHPEMFDTFQEMCDRRIRNAQAAYERYQKGTPNPRTQPREDFSKWRFMDMGNWKHTEKGNYTILVGRHRVTLFRKMGDWRWSINDITDDRRKPKFGGDFNTIGDAQRDAWTSLIQI